MKTKVMTIVGTRPEIIKMSRVISELDKFTINAITQLTDVFNSKNYYFIKS